ncbi:major facilitator superfamily domain-containing protein [Dipodascopsis tothii]|uniref:major facilitator superfamily domain-containing protein n=1 Tax=Dipodascopsis tothii TaxID=44089 RepID=UPI0034CD58E9
MSKEAVTPPSTFSVSSGSYIKEIETDSRQNSIWSTLKFIIPPPYRPELSREDVENPNGDTDKMLNEMLVTGPSAWTPAEEKQVCRKTDMRILAWACIMFFSLELDRANISNVLTTDFLENNNMTTSDYNLGQTVNLICFLVMEIPSQMIIRLLGPEVWIPVMMVAWGIVAFCQAFITDRTTFLLTRALLGICEGGFIPGLVLYLTSFYKAHELAVRFAWIWGMSSLTDIVSSLLAVPILQIKNVPNWYDWQWLFLIEGLLTAVIGIATAYVLPSIRRKVISRIFTPRETAILRAKVILDDDSKAVSHERKKALSIDPLMVVKALFDPYLFPIFLLGFLGFIPSVQSNTYLTLNLRQMDFTTMQSNLLTIPSKLVVIVTMFIVSRISDKFKIRWIFPIVAAIWVIPSLVALVVLPEDADRWSRYACVTLVVGYPYFHPILIAWVSENCNNHERRALAMAWYNIFVQCGKIAGSNIYQAKDKPLYRTGNKALIGIAVAVIVVSLATRAWFGVSNKRRANKWAALTEDEKSNYIASRSMLENGRIDFQLHY